MSLLRLVLLVFALAGAVGLALSNPTMPVYLRFVDQELDKAIGRMDQSTATQEQRLIHQFFASQRQKIVEEVVGPHTIRTNWGLASRYETSFRDIRIVVLGVAGHFIPLEGVEEAKIKLGRLAF